MNLTVKLATQLWDSSLLLPVTLDQPSSLVSTDFRQKSAITTVASNKPLIQGTPNKFFEG